MPFFAGRWERKCLLGIIICWENISKKTSTNARVWGKSPCVILMKITLISDASFAVDAHLCFSGIYYNAWVAQISCILCKAVSIKYLCILWGGDSASNWKVIAKDWCQPELNKIGSCHKEFLQLPVQVIHPFEVIQGSDAYQRDMLYCEWLKQNERAHYLLAG